MKWIILVLTLAGVAAGCTTQSQARAEAQKAYLAGQNAALLRMQAQSSPGITIVGPVQHSLVAWVAGITLAQAIATANYVSPVPPSQIIVNRQGQEETIDPNDLDRTAEFVLQAGDIVTLRQ